MLLHNETLMNNVTLSRLFLRITLRRLASEYLENPERAIVPRQTKLDLIPYHKIPLYLIYISMPFNAIYSDLRESEFPRETVSNAHPFDDQPNCCVQEAAKALGLAPKVILAHWQSGYSPSLGFYEWERDTLLFLVLGQPPRRGIAPLPESLRLDPLDAVKEISKLNISQLAVLVELFPLGLRGDHLRRFYGESGFWKIHEHALIHLMTEEPRLNGQDAVDFLCGNSNEEVMKISRHPRQELRGTSIGALWSRVGLGVTHANELLNRAYDDSSSQSFEMRKL